MNEERIILLNEKISLEKKEIKEEKYNLINFNVPITRVLISDMMIECFRPEDQVRVGTNFLYIVDKNNNILFKKNIVDEFITINLSDDIVIINTYDINLLNQIDNKKIENIYPLTRIIINKEVIDNELFKVCKIEYKNNTLDEYKVFVSIGFNIDENELMIINKAIKYRDLCEILCSLEYEKENIYMYIQGVLFKIKDITRNYLEVIAINNNLEMKKYYFDDIIGNNINLEVLDSNTIVIDRNKKIYKNGIRLNKSIYDYMPMIDEDLSEDSKIFKVFKCIYKIGQTYSDILISQNNNTNDEIVLDKNYVYLNNIILEFNRLYDEIIDKLNNSIMDNEKLFVDISGFNFILINKISITKTKKDIDMISKEIDEFINK